MAGLRDITIKPELRKCKVGKRGAFFHKWADISTIVSPAVMRGGHNGGVVKYTVGIVEYQDGEVAQCNPSYIKFTDHKSEEYCWDD